MADYFSSIFTSNNTTLLPEVNDNTLPGILPITVHIEGVAQLLTNIQPHKASGPDNLPARFLKKKLLMRLLLYLINGCIPSITRSNPLTKYLELFLYLRKEIELSQIITDQHLSPISAPNF